MSNLSQCSIHELKAELDRRYDPSWCRKCGKQTADTWYVCPECESRQKDALRYARKSKPYEPDLDWRKCPRCGIEWRGFVADHVCRLGGECG